jgi:hypothetical protein
MFNLRPLRQTINLPPIPSMCIFNWSHKSISARPLSPSPMAFQGSSLIGIYQKSGFPRRLNLCLQTLALSTSAILLEFGSLLLIISLPQYDPSLSFLDHLYPVYRARPRLVSVAWILLSTAYDYATTSLPVEPVQLHH